MEVNKEQAERCIEIAEENLASGDLAKAQKFIKKSMHLYSTDRARLLSKKIEARMNSSSEGMRHRNTTSSAKASSAGRASNPSPSPSSSAPPSGRDTPVLGKDYTKDQVEACKKVKECKDYYSVLGLDKATFDESKLKKAYRKYALQFHPDKNSAPGADEAFKRVGKAYSVLSDSEKKKNYDLYGDDEPQSGRRGGGGFGGAGFGGGGRTYYYSSGGFGGAGEEISPEDIFNMFFNGGFPAGHRTHGQRRPTARARAGDPRTGGGDQGAGEFSFIQILPLILLVLFSFLSMPSMHDPPFSLTRTDVHVHQRATEAHDIPYFVKKTFAREYKNSRAISELEESVRKAYVKKMQQQCYYEQQTRQRMVDTARYYNNREKLERAYAMAMPACDALHTVKA
eukprot:Nk52_evm22s295 gene=Nk52_evmTU22s295